MQFNDSLHQLFQLSYTLQAYAEQNRVHSQQLQGQHGTNSKVKLCESSHLCCCFLSQPDGHLQVAEKLMLAHCEQELAQRARIVSETRATVQLPPFAQVSHPTFLPWPHS